MPKLEPPPEVQRIFEKPGREWTPEERRRVYIWLFEEYWLRDLLTFALRNLGNGATFQDAEDAWDDFCVQRLEAVIANYDPQKARKEEQETQEAERSEKPSIWGYLKFSFARYCGDKREQLQKKRQRVVSLDEAREGEEGELPQLELVDPWPSPADLAIRTNFLESLNSCLQELKNPLHRQVFILRDIEGLSGKETAQRLEMLAADVLGMLLKGDIPIERVSSKALRGFLESRVAVGVKMMLEKKRSAETKTYSPEEITAGLSLLSEKAEKRKGILGKKAEEVLQLLLEVSEDSVKVWLRRARLHLRDCLRAKGWEMP